MDPSNEKHRQVEEALNPSQQEFSQPFSSPPTDDTKTMDIPPTPPSPHTRTALTPLPVPSPSGPTETLYSQDTDIGGNEGENEAGPSHHRQSSIPPPANARRHRSGILMTQARSRASSGGFKGGNAVVGSKSFGDLSQGFPLSPNEGDGDEIETLAGKEFRRITSEGHRRSTGDGDENIWDNRYVFSTRLRVS